MRQVQALQPQQDSTCATRRRGGFSLVEMMISVALLAVGLSTVSMMQIYAMRDGSKGRHTAAAAMFAREQIEQIQNVPFSMLRDKSWMASETWMTAAGLEHGTTGVYMDTADLTPSMEQAYTIDWRISPVTPVNNDIKNIEVSVSWQEGDSGLNKTFTLATIVVNNKR